MTNLRAVAALFLLILVPLASAACDRGGAATEDVSQQVAETPVEAFFRYGPVAFGADRAAIRRTLGVPDSMSIDTVTNRHDTSLIDTIFTLHYPGFSPELYRATYDGRELLVSVVITDDRYLRPESPLRIGMSEDEVRLLLGEPSAAADDVLHYTCSSCDAAGYDELELRLVSGQLRRIMLHYWID